MWNDETLPAFGLQSWLPQTSVRVRAGLSLSQSAQHLVGADNVADLDREPVEQVTEDQ